MAVAKIIAETYWFLDSGSSLIFRARMMVVAVLLYNPPRIARQNYAAPLENKLLKQITEIGNGRNHDHGQPDLVRSESQVTEYRLIRNNWKNDPGNDQEFSQGKEFGFVELLGNLCERFLQFGQDQYRNYDK